MPQTQAPSPSPASLVVRVLVPFGIGYFLSFLYRTVNAVVGPELAADLGLSPADIGLITSAYFIAFAAFQIPLGVLLDRYGPRLVEACLLLVAALGAVLFARAGTTLELAVGRGLIGLGVSGCLMAAMKANVQWWRPERLPLANGCILAMGGMGALVATAPVQAALGYVAWPSIFLGLAVLTVLVAAALLLAVPKRHQQPTGETWGQALRGAVLVFAEPAFLRVAPLAVTAQATFLAYHGLWASAWLREVDGLDRVGASHVLAVATLGIVVGTVASGLVAERLAKRGVPTMVVAGWCAVLFMLVQAALVLGLPIPAPLAWGAFAFFGMSTALFFAVLAQAFPPSLGGRVNTALNMLIFVAAFALQWLVGVVLGLWPVEAAAEAHRAVLTGLLGLHGAALAWLVGKRAVSTPAVRATETAP